MSEKPAGIDSSAALDQGRTDNLLRQILAQLQGTKGIEKLAASYVKAWGELGTGVKNDANNPHFGNDYATLGAVLGVLKPVFARHDLALFMSYGEIVNGATTVIWILMHTSGQTLQGVMHCPMGGKVTSQAQGSAGAYGRRYLGLAIGGLAQTDDDGEASSTPTPPPAKPKKEKSVEKPDKVEKKEGTYADEKAALLEAIEGCETKADLEEHKYTVYELDDQEVAAAYIAKAKALKGKK